MMPTTRLKVFVSSVQKELAEERRAVAAFISNDPRGILDMIARCRDAGLPAPEFRQSGGQFIQTLMRPTSGVTPEVTPEVRLARVLIGEMTRQELQRALGLKDDEHFRKAYLQAALDAGVIEMTIPDKPRSSRQRYRLAGKGATKGPKASSSPRDGEKGTPGR